MGGVADLTTSDEEKAAGVPSKEQGLHDAVTELAHWPSICVMSFFPFCCLFVAIVAYPCSLDYRLETSTIILRTRIVK